MKSGDIKKLQFDLQKFFPNSNNLFGKGSRVEKGTLDDGTILYLIDGELIFFEIEKRIIPFLRILLKNLIQLQKVTVDLGAVPYVARGAAVMVPGIVATDEDIKKDDYVVIVDEKHDKPLAIGLALMDANEIIKEKKGKAIKTVHYVGDKWWEFGKNVVGK